MNVVAIAVKYGMTFGSDDYVEIAGLPSVSSGIAFSCDANALPVARARFDSYFEWLGSVDHAFAVADRARRNIFAATVATRAGHVKLHAIRALLDRTFALALRADAR